MRLEGKVALVTGGGRGIGKAIALAFAREGARLVLGSRTRLEVEATAADARSIGRQAIALEADVSQKREPEYLVASALAHLGRIDILVNNAAVQPPIGPLWESDPDEWLKTLLINLGGVFLCCRATIPVMIRQGGGKIINLSGGGATSPRPYFSAYAASKTAVVRLTETLAEELKPFNMQAWMFRFANVVGARMGHGVIYDFIRKLKHNPEEIEILGDGQQEKPFFLVEDCIEGIFCAFRNSDAWCDVFNLGCSSSTKISRVTEIVAEEMGLSGARFRYTGGRRGWVGDVPQVGLDMSKMKKLGWETKHTSDEAIRIAARRLLAVTTATSSSNGRTEGLDSGHG